MHHGCTVRQIMSLTCHTSNQMVPYWEQEMMIIHLVGMTKELLPKFSSLRYSPNDSKIIFFFIILLSGLDAQ